MSTMAIPFERVVKMEKSNCDLILATEDGYHSVNDLPDGDWLSRLSIDQKTLANIVASGDLDRRPAYRSP